MDKDILSLAGLSYKDLNFSKIEEGYFSAYKNIGYTPLQVLEEIQSQLSEKIPMTYVGRLDPMAEGWFDIVFNGDMELKARLMQKDKVYEIEILFGVSTDTGDVLGLVQAFGSKHVGEEELKKVLTKTVGKHTWKYPQYSSPHIADPEADKSKDIEIYNISDVNLYNISSLELRKKIFHKLDTSRMPGDFRLELIREEWETFFKDHEVDLQICSCKVSCSTGTYMRTLAEVVGKEFSVPALAFGIKRI